MVSVASNMNDAFLDKDILVYLPGNKTYMEGLVDRLYQEFIMNRAYYDIDNILDWKHFMLCTSIMNFTENQ